jgi:hypothetical protein
MNRELAVFISPHHHAHHHFMLPLTFGDEALPA